MLRVLVAGTLATMTLTLGCCESMVFGEPTDPAGSAAGRSDVAEPATRPASAPVRLTEQQKIERILELLSASDATFVRNEAEFGGKDAAAHLRAKLNNVGALIPSARAFIEQIASKSSASGRPYLVRQKDGKTVEAARWFGDLLASIENPGGGSAEPARPSALGVVFTIGLDATEAPELKEWGEKARGICEKQYPLICEMLNSEGFVPRADLKIVFKNSMRVPAATGGGTISVNGPYVTQHSDDFGMMVHELTHAVQMYGRGKPNMGWLTEGIADYIRFYVYEPGADHSRIDTAKATYHDSYRTTAAFLNFLEVKHQKGVVKKLNARMREGTCDEGTFKELLGTEVGDLWKEFVADLEAKRANGQPKR